MTGKTALITGSTSGIGLGIARVFAARKFDICLHGFASAAEADLLQMRLREEFGIRVSFSDADLKNADGAELAARHALEALGQVDVLVNNAGIQHVAAIEDFPREKWLDILAVNLTAAFETSKTLLPQMKARGWGRIINIASAHGLVASVNKSAYVAAKHGLIGLTKVTALENARTGVTCNAICPGWVRTPLVEAQIEAKAKTQGLSLDEATAQLLGEKQPSQVFVTPEQIGEMAAFLCSDAAAQMTGTTLTADGGWTAQ